MRRILTLLLLATSMVSFSQSKDEKAIYKLLNDQVVAWNNADLVTFMEGYWKNDSLMFIGKSGVTYGWQNTLDNYKKGYPNKAAMGDFTSTVIQLKKLSKNFYSVTGKWYLKRTIGDATGHYTLLIQKINGKWLIISDHSS
ncbi:MAG: DUF4440 domain-containing protein [Chitinophagales bacterium]|nr:DUF4440 domain-containing protein [Chitinophagales bacterium]